MKKLIISLASAIYVAMTVFSAEDTRTVIKTYHFDHFDRDFFVPGAELTQSSMAWFTQNIEKQTQDYYYIEPSSGGLYKFGQYNYGYMNILKGDTIFMEPGKYYFAFQIRIDGDMGKKYRCPDKKEDITVYVNSEIWNVAYVLVDDDWSCFTVCGPTFEIGEETCKTPAREYVDNISSHSAKLHWTLRDNSQSHFFIQFRESGTDEWYLDETNGNSYTFHDLKANTSYEYQVSADCSSGSDWSYSAWSAIRWLHTTEEAGETEEEPKLTSFMVYDVTSNSATFSWAGNFKTAELRYKRFMDAEWTTVSNLSGTSYTATDLESDVRYTSQVRLLNGNKATDWSTGETFITLKEEDPEIPEIIPLCDVWATGTYDFITSYAFESPVSATILAYTDNNWSIDAKREEPVFASDGNMVVVTIELDKADDWRGTYSVSNGKLDSDASGIVEIKGNVPSVVYKLISGKVEIDLNEEGTAYDMQYSLSTKNTANNETLNAKGTIHDICASELPDPNAAVQGLEKVQRDKESCTKVLREGMLLIKRGNKIYSLMGEVIEN